jgi:hypothetical protein
MIWEPHLSQLDIALVNIRAQKSREVCRIENIVMKTTYTIGIWFSLLLIVNHFV